MNEDEESKLTNRNSVKKKKVIKNLKYIFRLKQKKNKKKLLSIPQQYTKEKKRKCFSLKGNNIQ